MERWATFDCYGTLVDWNAGIRGELEKLFGVEHADELLVRYHELEPKIQAVQARRFVSRGPHDRARGAGCGDGADAARRRGERPREVAARLAGLRRRAARTAPRQRRRGWQLGILSNTDRDLIDASIEALGVPFDLAIVAGEIGSYKPAHRHWEVFYEMTGADRRGHVHVAQSLFHDIQPGERARHPVDLDQPARRARGSATRPLTLTGVAQLADALDALVP